MRSIVRCKSSRAREPQPAIILSEDQIESMYREIDRLRESQQQIEVNERVNVKKWLIE